MKWGGTLEKRRVVVTGMGLLTPIGLDTDENWDSAVKGKSGVTKRVSIPIEPH